MFSFFSKKSKKQQSQVDKAESSSTGEGVLSPHDEKFFKNLADNETREIPLDKALVVGETQDASTSGSTPTAPAPVAPTKSDGKKKSSRWPSFMSKKGGKTAEDGDGGNDASVGEAKQDWELQDAMKKLNLFSKGGKAFSLSSDTKELLDQFTQILKDVVNGVPTAYDDLIKLFDSSSQIEKKYDTLPSFLKKLITTLPTKLFPGGSAGGASFVLPTLQEMVANPETITSALKTVMSALETRFPAAALGTNALMSLALFVLLFILWYCYKRGRDVRLEKEAAGAKVTTPSADPSQAIAPAPSGATSPPKAAGR